MTKRHLAPPIAQPPEKNGWRIVAGLLYMLLVGLAAYLLL